MLVKLTIGSKKGENIIFSLKRKLYATIFDDKSARKLKIDLDKPFLVLNCLIFKIYLKMLSKNELISFKNH